TTFNLFLSHIVSSPDPQDLNLLDHGLKNTKIIFYPNLKSLRNRRLFNLLNSVKVVFSRIYNSIPRSNRSAVCCLYCQRWPLGRGWAPGSSRSSGSPVCCFSIQNQNRP